jgi:hypothetical protein
MPKFVFSGMVPNFFSTFLKLNLATATPITFPFSFTIGPPLLPGYNAASICILEKLLPTPVNELTIPLVTLTDELKIRNKFFLKY